MSRRPTENAGEFPLFLIPHVILQWIRKFGEELEWIRVRRSSHHFYTISIRTRPLRRGFGRPAAAAVKVIA